MIDLRKIFHGNIDDLHSKTSEIFGSVLDLIEGGTVSLLEGDQAHANHVISHHALIYDLADGIEDRVYTLLALQQPMAIDLRVLVSTNRIVRELERIAQLAADIAKETHTPCCLAHESMQIIDRMHKSARKKLLIAADAFDRRDPVTARSLSSSGQPMDELYFALKEATLAQSALTRDDVLRTIRAERVGDRFVTIATHTSFIGQGVLYIATGDRRGHEPLEDSLIA